MNQKRFLAAATCLAAICLLAAPPAWACYAIVVGRDASADGSVLLGHNEQDWGKRVLNFRKVPRRQFPAGAVVRLRGGATVPQVRETYAFLWSGNPGLAFSDSYLNEWGVAAASDGCSDREDGAKALEARGDLVQGGISYMLRRLVAERAKTAREGVQIAGDLIAQVGYPGARTLVIADSREAWLLAMAKGKHWVAQRVPDDEVALLPNRYTIGEVHLEDKANFLAPPDLIDYAVQRGWYDPASGKPFRFHEVYDGAHRVQMDVRQWRGQCLVTGQEIDMEPDRQLPFSVKPSHKLSLRDVRRFLCCDEGPGRLDIAQTMESAIFQLRTDLPPAIGCVYWRTTAQASTSVMTPWYAGVDKVPEIYHRPVPLERQLDVAYHFEDTPEKFEPCENNAWWIFKNLQDTVNHERAERLATVRKAWDVFEAKYLADQPAIEKKALELHKKNPEDARLHLTAYSNATALEALKQARSLEARLSAP